MTYEELKEKLNNLTPEQLKKDVILCDLFDEQYFHAEHLIIDSENNEPVIAFESA